MPTGSVSGALAGVQGGMAGPSSVDADAIYGGGGGTGGGISGAQSGAPKSGSSTLPEGIANLAVGLYKFVAGRKQQKQYEDMIKGLVNPIYQIPTEATKSLNLAESLAEPKTFAGQVQAEQKIDQAAAKAGGMAIRSATSPEELLASITDINASEMDAKNDIMAKAADNYLDRQGVLMGARDRYATYQDKKQERDVYDTFYRKSAAAAALREGAMRNQFAGFEQGVYALADSATASTSMLPALTGIPM